MNAQALAKRDAVGETVEEAISHTIPSPAAPISGNSQWEKVAGRLRAQFGEATFRSWLKPIEFSGLRSGTVSLAVPTRFMREWVQTHYQDALLRAWQTEDATVRAVDVFVKPAAFDKGRQITPNVPPSSSAPMVEDIPVQPATYASRPAIHVVDAADTPSSIQLDPRFTFDNFVVGKPNELAYAAARRVAESNSVSPGGNPLFLYGGVGLGKTHLMHAIAQHIRVTNPRRRVLYLSAEKFMYEFIRSLRDKNTMEFKEQFRSVDVLMVDDVQFISGKDSTQEEFFHTFNALVDQNKQVVISGDRSPSDLDGIEERVRSRLGWGLVVDVHATTYELRLGILQSKVEKLGASVPREVLEFLAHRITSNVRELEGALNRVVAHSTLVGHGIDLESTGHVLRDLIRANDRKVTVEDIQRKVAEHFNIKLADMYSARRSRMVARPRQVAMFLAKRLTTLSLPEIGRKFGGKDHTTVMHAVKRIEELCLEDPHIREDVDLLERLMQS
ncbi:chromosomal replication initiator protein DnaA [bacterium]|nr:chromosomal replication initiator protein DnaA [bacterium]